MKIKQRWEGISSVMFLRNSTKIMVFGCMQLRFLQNLTAYGKVELRKAEKNKQRRGFRLVSILFDSAPSQGLIGDFKIAVESTSQHTVPWPLLLKFESSSPNNVVLRLEDILGLIFRVEQEKFKIDIFNCQKQGRAIILLIQTSVARV